MPLKNKKAIIIKDDKLLRIRNNLRKLWIIVAISRQAEISKRQDENVQRTLKENLDPSETREEYINLERKWWEIERALRASICQCAICFQNGRDMIYNPITKEWYCTSCYNRNKVTLSKL